MKIGPLEPLSVRQLHGSKWWLVLEDYRFSVEVRGKVYEVRVPAGYRYDRSSIPWCFEWLISKDSLGCLGCLLHDVLYSSNGKWFQTSPWRAWTRAEADLAFRLVMIEDKIDLMRAWTAWEAVRVLGRRW